MRDLARSYLFVPGNRPDRFAKALASGAHAVVIDLEDAVAADDKQAARQAVAEWLDPAHPVVLRVNAVGSDWFRDDLALCARPGVRAVMIPKVEGADHVRLVAEGTGNRLPLLPLVESAQGLDRAADIARAPGVQRLAFGSLDFQLDLGLAGDGEETLYFRSHLTLVSRLAGVQPPVDGVWPGIDDSEQLRAHTLRARRREALHSPEPGGGRERLFPAQRGGDRLGETRAAGRRAGRGRHRRRTHGRSPRHPASRRNSRRSGGTDVVAPRVTTGPAAATTPRRFPARSRC
jgi:citrate lyase subunit beta/citryl-CoA lyase